MDTVWWADKFPSRERNENSQSINTHLVTNGNHHTMYVHNDTDMIVKIVYIMNVVHVYR